MLLKINYEVRIVIGDKEMINFLIIVRVVLIYLCVLYIDSFIGICMLL